VSPSGALVFAAGLLLGWLAVVLLDGMRPRVA
jgi:hypothetical protein